jgi:hypothetical protein
MFHHAFSILLSLLLLLPFRGFGQELPLNWTRARMKQAL